MNSVKKVAAMAASCTMLAMSLVACGDSANKSTETTTESTVSSVETTGNVSDSDKVYSVGICQLVEHPALDAATQGFKEALTEKLGENVKFDEANAQGESTNCATICSGYVSNNCDLILANATPALQAAAAATNSIPVIGTSVTDYATALDISDWSGSTGTNITGTSDLAPVDQQEDMLIELFPEAKKVGIIYCSSEANSKFQADAFEKALDEDGIAYAEFTASDSNEIQSVVTNAISECDVIYVPTDNTMASNAEIIKNVTVPAKVPVIAAEEGICKGCGVATLSISYYDLGHVAGKMAYEVLVNGKNPGEMPVEFASAVTKEYNADLCEEFGITPPEDYVAIAE